nr:hypothetical protein [Tanacetum cinerariifolium]
MMNQYEVNELRTERLAKSHDPLALMAHSQNSYKFSVTHNDQSSSSTHLQQSFPINNKYNPQPSLNQNFMQPPMTYLKDINDPTEAINAALILFAKTFQLTAPTNNNQRTSSNPRNCQIAQPGINMGQDRQIQNNAGVSNGGNQNGLVVVPGIANQNGTGNVVATRAEGTGIGNQARLSYSLLKKKKQGFIFKQKNLTSWLLQLDKAPVYDTDGSAERYIIIVRQTKNLQEADFAQIYDFLMMNQDENAGVSNGGNQNGLVVVPGIANQNGTGNVVATRAEGTGIGNQD